MSNARRADQRNTITLSCLALPRAGANHSLRAYLATLVFSTIMPVFLLVTVLLVYVVRTRVLKIDRKRCRDQTVFVLLLAVYLLLPPVSTVIFRGIQCACARGAVR